MKALTLHSDADFARYRDALDKHEWRRYYQICRWLRDARNCDDAKGQRIVEYLHQSYVVAPNNQGREEVAQLNKNKDYEGESPLVATEIFCQNLCHALAVAGLQTNVHPALFYNNRRLMNQIWHLRQMADLKSRHYLDWLRELIAAARYLRPGATEFLVADLVRVAVLRAE